MSSISYGILDLASAWVTEADGMLPFPFGLGLNHTRMVQTDEFDEFEYISWFSLKFPS